MKTKISFNILQVIILFMLFVVSIALGVTGAYYQSSKQGNGTVIFNKGLHYTLYNISIDSNKQLVSEGSILYYSDGTSANTYSAFQNISIGQSETYQIATPYIQGEEGTLPFYARAKLEYVFYYQSGENYVEITNTTAINDLKTKLFNNGTELQFDSNWVERNNGWFFYVDSTKNNLQEISSTSNIKLFNYVTAENGKFYSIMQTGEWADMQGGPTTTVADQTIQLAKLDIKITVEMVQTSGQSIWSADFNT